MSLSAMRPVAFCLWLSLLPYALSQTPDAPPDRTELTTLRSMIEQQNRQLETLQDRVLRLQEMVSLLLTRSGISVASNSSQPNPNLPNPQPTHIPPLTSFPLPLGTTPEALSGSPKKAEDSKLGSFPDSRPLTRLPAPGFEAARVKDSPSSPVPSPTPQHLVEKGQTLISIAKQHSVSVSELQKINRIEDVRKLQVGQKLILPAPPHSPSTSVPTAPPAPQNSAGSQNPVGGSDQ